MNDSTLHSRIQNLSESLKQTRQSIIRLSKLPSQTGPSKDSQFCTELSAEIHQSLKEQEEHYELFKQEAEDITNSASWSRRRDITNSARDREKDDIASFTASLGDDLKMYDTFLWTHRDGISAAQVHINSKLTILDWVERVHNSAKPNCKQEETQKL